MKSNMVNYIMVIFILFFIPASILHSEEVLPLPLTGFEDNGSFKLYINDSPIATITYELDKQGNFKRDFNLAMAGQKISGKLVVQADKNGYWNEILVTSSRGDTMIAKRKGDKADYTNLNEGQVYSTQLTAGHILYDSFGIPFESIMLKQYDMQKKGKQLFPRYLVPLRIVDFKVEYMGTDIRKIKEKDIAYMRFDIDIAGVPVQVWAESNYKIDMFISPTQYATFVRDGYEELLSVRSEDPLMSKPKYEYEKKTEMISMRDGVKLATDLYFPRNAEGKLPVIFMRTPYKKDMMELKGEYYARRGYVTAIQDCRGRFASEGKWEPFVNEPQDGYDSIEWLGTQEWSNGKVGMIGASYGGWVQLWAAVEKPPHLTTIIPNVAPPDPFYNIPYEYGSFYLFGAAWWAQILEKEATNEISGSAIQNITNRKYEQILKKLPVIDLDKDIFGKTNEYWRKWIQNNINTGYWDKSNFMSRLKDLDIPVFLQSGWFDGDGIGTKLNYMELKKSKNKNIKLIIGPWGHADTSSATLGEIKFDANAAIDLQSLYLRWFDYWLKGIDNKITEEPLVQVYTMFSNKWETASTYPLPQTEPVKYYLSAKKGANTSKGDGEIRVTPNEKGKPFDRYIYDPGDPTPCPFYYYQSEEEKKKESEAVRDMEELKKEREGFHNRITDTRNDILVFKTESLKEAVTVAGPMSAVIYASSSAKDTDWFVSIMDEDEKGELLQLNRGTLRARFRNSTQTPEMLEPGKVYAFTIDLWQTGMTFQEGHRIRIEISSALFPLFSRNLNTGGHNEMDTEYVKATQTIYYSKEYPSHIILPVLKK